MYQDIITFCIVTGAVAYTLWSLVRAVRPRKSSACGDCTGCLVKKDLQASITKKISSHVTGNNLSQF